MSFNISIFNNRNIFLVLRDESNDIQVLVLRIFSFKFFYSAKGQLSIKAVISTSHCEVTRFVGEIRSIWSIMEIYVFKYLAIQPKLYFSSEC